MEDKRFLFAGGNARSGTTALAGLLNSHPRVFLTVERYIGETKADQLRPELFSKENMLSDKAPNSLAKFEGDLSERWDQATYIGDKVPALYLGFNSIDENFPDAKIVYIVRNPIGVAGSYERRRQANSWKRDVVDAVKQWNRSVNLGLKRVKGGGKLIVVPYEDLFKSRQNLDRLFAALDLDPAEADEPRLNRLLKVAENLGAKQEERDEELFRYVSLNAYFRAYRELVTEHSILSD